MYAWYERKMRISEKKHSFCNYSRLNLEVLTWTNRNSLQLTVLLTDGKEVIPKRTKKKNPRIPKHKYESLSQAVEVLNGFSFLVIAYEKL